MFAFLAETFEDRGRERCPSSEQYQHCSPPATHQTMIAVNRLNLIVQPLRALPESSHIHSAGGQRGHAPTATALRGLRPPRRLPSTAQRFRAFRSFSSSPAPSSREPTNSSLRRCTSSRW